MEERMFDIESKLDDISSKIDEINHNLEFGFSSDMDEIKQNIEDAFSEVELSSDNDIRQLEGVAQRLNSDITLKMLEVTNKINQELSSVNHELSKIYLKILELKFELHKSQSISEANSRRIIGFRVGILSIVMCVLLVFLLFKLQ